MSGPTTATNSSFVQVTEAGQQPKGGAKVVAGYALQQKLGSGSFAVVYKGVRVVPSPQHANTVAIKAIARTSEKLTKKVLQNLEIEIAILRTYRHQNIVCLHDVQKTDRHFYLLLEYCGGGDVQGLIRSRKNGRLTEGLTRRLMRDLAAGLKFLWGQELIHRDIKPQNLLLTGALPLDEVDDPDRTEELYQKRLALNFPSHQFALKIADFGFARHLQTTSLAETLCGSPLYMAPEILQHHRYDAKADLWSVGTVLFEMIAGRPPFHGENHIDLLRNIQRKAVRLPADVKVSKECVNLLRLLLNRNPLSRAGFTEFFDACDALVALGHRGPPTTEVEQNILDRPEQRIGITGELGTIQEKPDIQTAESMLTVATTMQHQPAQPSTHHFVQQPVSAIPLTAAPVMPNRTTFVSSSPRTIHSSSLAPLVPSPPAHGMQALSPPAMEGIPPHLPLDDPSHRRQQTAQLKPNNMEMTVRRNAETGTLQRSAASENSFVMVGHGSYNISPTTSTAVTNNMPLQQQHHQHQPSLNSPPASPHHNTNQVLPTRGDYSTFKQPKGMLSTSPGTGGALMGMMTGRARLLYDNTVPGMQLDTHMNNLTKMLAAAEDVGRRAVCVAHLGDSRAYIAMKMVMMSDGASSSLISGAMEGIEEEADSGAVTDDSSSTEIMASTRVRRSSMNEKSMHDAKDEDDGDENEMPFALASEAQSPPILSAGMPTRVSTSFAKSTNTSSSMRQSIRPTPLLIRNHYSEGLSCYLKALKMLKGALHGGQGVDRELRVLTSRINQGQIQALERLVKRSQMTLRWLGEQYKGVLERAEASNNEISKIPNQSASSDKGESPRVYGVEELIYNNALSFGREGAVKQLLGQLEASRSSYRSAGLLAETLLMEPNLVGNDRNILEDYVNGFAARITELDELILQQSKLVASGGTGAASLSSSRRASGVVGLVGQPFSGHKLAF